MEKAFETAKKRGVNIFMSEFRRVLHTFMSEIWAISHIFMSEKPGQRPKKVRLRNFHLFTGQTRVCYTEKETNMGAHIRNGVICEMIISCKPDGLDETWKCEKHA